jgi:acyl dehydratase
VDNKARLGARIGQTQYSDWVCVDQTMIDRFAEATLDRQFIHVDPARAAETPFGGTVAHGFLTLSLLSHLASTLPREDTPAWRMGVNYGLDRVRFVTPVRAGSRVRGAFTLTDLLEKRPGQFQQTFAVTVEIYSLTKPALTAIWLNQLFF